MPINRKWPIDAVVDAVKGVRLRSRERITFEYVLLGGVTDQPEHAAYQRPPREDQIRQGGRVDRWRRAVLRG